MQRSAPFSRASNFVAALAALMASGSFTLGLASAQLGGYRSRGNGEGCSGNKRAKSSFKQNKRKGL